MLWTLAEFSDTDPTLGISGYAVYDAPGVRIGHVSGLVSDEENRIRMLKVAVREWSGTSDYLVPSGAITMIDDSKAVIQLRDLTKESIARRCFHFKGDLPEHRLLLGLQRHFPPPPHAVIERLRGIPPSQAAPSRVPSWTRLSELASE